MDCLKGAKVSDTLDLLTWSAKWAEDGAICDKGESSALQENESPRELSSQIAFAQSIWP